MTNQTRAFLLAGLTALCWSTVSTAFKIALQTLSPTQLIFVSMLTAALFLLAVLAVQGNLGDFGRLSRRQWGCALLLGCLLNLYYSLLFIAYEYLPAQIAQPINYTWALMLALLASLCLKQRLSLKEFLCMLLAYSGVVLISTGAGDTLGPLPPLGLACVVASTLLYALYWIANTKSTLPPVPGLVLCFAMAGLLSLIVLLVRGEALMLPLRPLLGGIYVGLFELAIPFLLWGMALRLTTSVARISTLPFLVPFLALFWISLVLHEPIAATTLIGLCLIVAGTFLQQRLAARRKTDRPSRAA